jgi:hypothetical protein
VFCPQVIEMFNSAGPVKAMLLVASANHSAKCAGHLLKSHIVFPEAKRTCPVSSGGLFHCFFALKSKCIFFSLSNRVNSNFIHSYFTPQNHPGQ